MVVNPYRDSGPKASRNVFENCLSSSANSNNKKDSTSVTLGHCSVTRIIIFIVIASLVLVVKLLYTHQDMVDPSKEDISLLSPKLRGLSQSKSEAGLIKAKLPPRPLNIQKEDIELEKAKAQSISVKIKSNQDSSINNMKKKDHSLSSSSTDNVNTVPFVSRETDQSKEIKGVSSILTRDNSPLKPIPMYTNDSNSKKMESTLIDADSSLSSKHNVSSGNSKPIMGAEAKITSLSSIKSSHPKDIQKPASTQETSVTFPLIESHSLPAGNQSQTSEHLRQITRHNESKSSLKDKKMSKKDDENLSEHNLMAKGAYLTLLNDSAVAEPHEQPIEHLHIPAAAMHEKVSSLEAEINENKTIRLFEHNEKIAFQSTLNKGNTSAPSSDKLATTTKQQLQHQQQQHQQQQHQTPSNVSHNSSSQGNVLGRRDSFARQEISRHKKEFDSTGANARSKFDLPESVTRENIRLASSAKIRNASAESNAHEKIDYCAGVVDPFDRIPVQSFTPPVGATFEKAVEWKNAVNNLVKTISKLRIGGEQLRAQMQKEVDSLKVMRFKLFCMYA